MMRNLGELARCDTLLVNTSVKVNCLHIGPVPGTSGESVLSPSFVTCLEVLMLDVG
jgi:hypothetical protein